MKKLKPYLVIGAIALAILNDLFITRKADQLSIWVCLGLWILVLLCDKQFG